MTQWILTSSLLILAVLLIRFLGRDKLSARVRYALWALVLLRLLMPFSIGESALSVQNLFPETQAAQVQTEPILISDIIETTQTTETIEMPMIPIAEGETSRTYVNTTVLIWVVGSMITALIFIIGNLRFAAQLRRSRRKVMHRFVPVYMTEAVETPCLYGLWTPAVYVTPEVWGNETALRHVLAHELTHYRHKDHIWSVLRCVCVTLHWFNPLVWAAAILSQKDAEMACDEGTLLRLGEQERTGYAKTLVDLTCVGYKGMLITATSVTGSDSDLKQRVLRIVKNPKMSAIAVIVVLAVAIVAALAVFTGARIPDIEGVWRMELSYLGVDVDDSAKAYMEYEFFDGLGRRRDIVGDNIRFAENFTYTVDEDLLTVQFDSRVEKYVWSITDDQLILRQNKREMAFISVEREEKPYLPDGYWEIYNLTVLRPNEEQYAGLNETQSAQLMELLREGAIVETRRETLTNVPYQYRMDLAGKDKYKPLRIANGLVYGGDAEKGYVLSNISEIEAFLNGLQWAEQYYSYRGMIYYLYEREDLVNVVRVDLGHNYAYTVPEQQDVWRKTMADLKTVASKEKISQQEAHLWLRLKHNDEWWYFYPDGSAYIAGDDLYLTPQQALPIMELMQPYMLLWNIPNAEKLPSAENYTLIQYATDDGVRKTLENVADKTYLEDLIRAGMDERIEEAYIYEGNQTYYELFGFGFEGNQIVVTDTGNLYVDSTMYPLTTGEAVISYIESLINPSITAQTDNFVPADIQNIQSARLILRDRAYPADSARLEFLEELLSTAEDIGYPTKCPFYGTLEVTLSDGRVLGVTPAMDSCSAFMIGDVCYEYGNQFAYDDEGSYDNSGLLAVFGLTPELLEELIVSNLQPTEGEVLGTSADIGDVVREQNDVMEPIYLSDEVRETMIALLAQGKGEALEGEFAYDTTYYTIFSSGQDTEDGCVLLSDNGSLSMDGVVYELSTGQELLVLLDAFYHQIRITIGGQPATDLTGVVGEFLYPELGGVPEDAEILWSSDNEAVCTVTGDAYGGEIFITGIGEATVIAEYTENGQRYGYSVRIYGTEP